jgi:hypothetical protein
VDNFAASAAAAETVADPATAESAQAPAVAPAPRDSIASRLPSFALDALDLRFNDAVSTPSEITEERADQSTSSAPPPMTLSVTDHPLQDVPQGVLAFSATSIADAPLRKAPTSGVSTAAKNESSMTSAPGITASFLAARARPIGLGAGTPANPPLSGESVPGNLPEPPLHSETASLFAPRGTDPIFAGEFATTPVAKNTSGQKTPFSPAPSDDPWGSNADALPTSSATGRLTPGTTSVIATDTTASAPGTASDVAPMAVVQGLSHSDPKSSAALAPAGTDAPSSRTALQQRSEDGPELSVGLQAWNGGEKAAAGTAPANPLAGSEMNVALRTEGLGAVQLRAHVTGDQLGAAITVERHDAHALLSADLPALHQALSDRQLRVENLSLLQGSSHAGAGVGNNAGRQQSQDGTSPRLAHHGSAAAPFVGAAESTLFSEAPENPTAFDSNGRLSVQA